MNKVHGKAIFTQNYFPFKSYDKELVFLQRIGIFFFCHAQGKKTFLSQSMQSTFAKLFAHGLLVVLSKIFKFKMQKNNLVWAS
jgi:hypothetical protein